MNTVGRWMTVSIISSDKNSFKSNSVQEDSEKENTTRQDIITPAQQFSNESKEKIQVHPAKTKVFIQK